MLFTEPIFLFVFLPALLGLYTAAGPRHRNALLLVASLLFYTSGGGAFVFLMIGSIAFNYAMAVIIDGAADRSRRRTVLAFTIVVNLAVLGWYKYANFISANLNAAMGVFGGPSLPLTHVVLPIGISFFTFHAISYVVDVYRGDAIAQKSPVHAGLYMLLFPQLIAGPIIRYRDIAGQILDRRVTLEGFSVGVRRFAIGLAKKMLIANTVAATADAIFALPSDRLTLSAAWLGATCYAVQIYFDFSGYSDMAIGLGRMFGFTFPENFNYPYAATSVRDFWRRWHISLSTWFRDYLYIPLGGARRSRGRQYSNLVLVFFLCGLWHGASWSFVVWGLFHGAFLVIERRVFEGSGRAADASGEAERHTRWRWASALGSRTYTLVVVLVGWVFFRADTLTHAASVLGAMVGITAHDPLAQPASAWLTLELVLTLAVGAIAATPIARVTQRELDALLARREGAALTTASLAADSALTACVAVLLVASLLYIAAGTYNPFIYFRF